MITNSRFLIGTVLMTSVFVLVLSTQELNETVASSPQVGTAAETPVLDYDKEITKERSRARKDKDNRFNGRGIPNRNGSIVELPPGIEPLPTNSHWWVGLPALPVAQSDVVVLGEVVDRAAHLSGDRSGIYSEFTIRIDEVLKDIVGVIHPTSFLSVDRVGGTVRFASGRLQKYSTRWQGMPRKGGQYVLFLQKSNDYGDLLILTGYELSSGRVAPLDGEDNKEPGSVLPFAKYKDADQSVFLGELRAAVQNSNTGGVK